MQYECACPMAWTNCLKWYVSSVVSNPYDIWLDEKKKLHMHKNKWWEKKTNEIFSYNLEFLNEEGTRLSASSLLY